MAGTVDDFTPGGVFQGSNINFTSPQSSSSSSITGTYVTDVQVIDTETLRVYFSTGLHTDYALPEGGGGGGGSGTDYTVDSLNLSGDILTLQQASGNSVTVDLSSLIPAQDSDTNNFVTAIALTDSNELQLTRNGGLATLSQSLDAFDEIDNQTGAQQSFEQGGVNYVFSAAGKLTITTAAPPVPNFNPGLTDPTPESALESQTYMVPVTVNDGFELDDTASSVDVTLTDTNGNDTAGSGTISGTTITVSNVPAGTETIDVTATLVDTDGDTDVVETSFDQIIPYFTGTTAQDTEMLAISASNGLTASTESIHTPIDVAPSAANNTGRVRYWIMLAQQSTFSQNGFDLQTTETSGTISGITYYLYDLGLFGNPFNSSAAAPTITIDVKEV